MQPRDQFGLVVEGTDVQRLHAQPLGQRVQADAIDGRARFPRRRPPDRSGEHRAVDPAVDHAHQRPAPSRLVARRGERVHVVGPPQAFQRRDDVVAAEILAGELQRVGQRVERLDRRRERRR
nr:hypothetical protein [Luteimonas sp. Y-2-2-4F]